MTARHSIAASFSSSRLNRPRRSVSRRPPLAIAVSTSTGQPNGTLKILAAFPLDSHPSFEAIQGVIPSSDSQIPPFDPDRIINPHLLVNERSGTDAIEYEGRLLGFVDQDRKRSPNRVHPRINSAKKVFRCVIARVKHMASAVCLRPNCLQNIFARDNPV